VAEVLETTWGEKPLKVGGNAGNKFFIRLSATESVADEQKKLITENIHTLQTKGFPNCFGAQRFGKGNKNFWEAKQVMKGTTGKNPPEVAYRLRFMLQAYASMYFNEYVMRRWEKGLHWLSGDIVVDRYYAEGAKVGVYQHQEVRLFDY
jgi:tRNA(Glu) U13 pseudouridine synthase TruD